MLGLAFPAAGANELIFETLYAYAHYRGSHGSQWLARDGHEAIKLPVEVPPACWLDHADHAPQPNSQC